MEHPITPPDPLMQQWRHQWWSVDPDCLGTSLQHYIADQASQWGWDQRGAANEAELQQARDEELEACYEWLYFYGANGASSAGDARNLRAARRPKPPSLKEQALGAMGRFTVNAHTNADEMNRDFDTIRLALEALPND